MTVATVEDPTIQQALVGVMREVRALGKEDRNDYHRFNFRGIDATLNAIGPALRNHGVIVFPTILEDRAEWVPTQSGGQSRLITVKVRYTFIGPSGDSIETTVIGEAADTGDKGFSKAQSVAMRVALLQTFSLPTQEKDPDAYTYEIGTPAEAAPEPQRVNAERADQQPRQVQQAPPQDQNPPPQEDDKRARWMSALGKARGDLEKLGILRAKAVEASLGAEYLAFVDAEINAFGAEDDQDAADDQAADAVVNAGGTDYAQAVRLADAAEDLNLLEQDAEQAGVQALQALVAALKKHRGDDQTRIKRVRRKWEKAAAARQ